VYAHGNDIVAAVLLLQLLNLEGGGRTVHTTLAGEVLDEYFAIYVGRLHVDEPLLLADVAARGKGEEKEESGKGREDSEE
jgi:hypothetical protein